MTAAVSPEIAAALVPLPARHVHEVDTPAVLIDIDIAEANIRRAHEHLAGLGLRIRPHVKTHKLPAMAKLQQRLGASGITAQKVSEAAAMADAGLDDILIPYNVLGPTKLARLVTLRKKAKLTVAADSETTVAGYAEAFADGSDPLPVMVECDTGAGRCGVQRPADALALARVIDAAPGLCFAGLLTYPAPGKGSAASAWLREAIGLLREAGLDPPVVSGGGTPDLYRASEVPELTEHRPGTYVYSDRMQVALGHSTLDDCALTVLATVVSRPTLTRAILDAGSKALTSDLVAADRADLGHGYIREAPEAVIAALSEEHATVRVPEGLPFPAIGETVRIVPNHACPVTNLFDQVVAMRGEEVLGALEVVARGTVT